MKKTDLQQIPNHSQTNITYNVIEHQSADNTITYSNGYVTTSDIGVYEVTFDVSFSSDNENPLDPSPREAWIKCSDFPGEKFGYDRRVSPGDSDPNNMVRYTSSCYVKTTSTNATISLCFYQNNSDGDAINTNTHTTSEYARLCCRRVA